MKRTIALVVGIVFCIFSVLGGEARAQEPARVSRPSATSKSVDPVETTVYVTKTGAKYHRDSCRHLSRSKIAMSLKEAARNYGPCSVCKPPIPSVPVERTINAPARTEPSRAASSTRCQAITKAGTQCKRNAQPGRSYCWQH